LATTAALAEEVPDDIVFISESGIKTPKDAAFVSKTGADGIVVGPELADLKVVRPAPIH